MRLTAIVLGALACAPPPPADDPSSQDTAAPAVAADSDAPPVVETDAEPEAEPSLVVEVYGPEGRPLGEGFEVRACFDECFIASLGESGFEIPVLEPGPRALQVYDRRSPSTLPTLLLPIQMGEGPRRIRVSLAKPGPRVDLPTLRAPLDLSGLTLTLAAGDLSNHDAGGEAPTWVSASRSPDAEPPIENGPVGQELVALWYLMPFDAASKTPVGVTVENAWGLEDGEASLWYATFGAARWFEVGELVRVEDGRLAPRGSGSIPLVTTLAIFRNPPR